MNILVRFNHNSAHESTRWRFIWDGHEMLCASVKFFCGTETTKNPVLVNGEIVAKWHISPIDPKKVMFDVLNDETHITVL